MTLFLLHDQLSVVVPHLQCLRFSAHGTCCGVRYRTIALEVARSLTLTLVPFCGFAACLHLLRLLSQTMAVLQNLYLQPSGLSFAVLSWQCLQPVHSFASGIQI